MMSDVVERTIGRELLGRVALSAAGGDAELWRRVAALRGDFSTDRHTRSTVRSIAYVAAEAAPHISLAQASTPIAACAVWLRDAGFGAGICRADAASGDDRAWTLALAQAATRRPDLFRSQADAGMSWAARLAAQPTTQRAVRPHDREPWRLLVEQECRRLAQDRHTWASGRDRARFVELVSTLAQTNPVLASRAVARSTDDMLAPDATVLAELEAVAAGRAPAGLTFLPV